MDKNKEIMGEAQNTENQVSDTSLNSESEYYESLVLKEPKQLDNSIPTLYLCTLARPFSGVKRRLFQMINHFENVQIVDVGQLSKLKKANIAIENSIQHPHHTTVVLSEKAHSLQHITSSYQKHQEPWNLGNCSPIGNELWKAGSLNPIFQDNIYLNNIIQMGLQLQDTPLSFFDAMDEAHYEHYRIGAFREMLRDIEPIMRDLHVLQFNCNTIKVADFPAKQDANPSGFQSEEALQILKYAGISPKLGFVMINGLTGDLSKDSTSTDWLAQAIWYITQGVDARIEDDPYQLDNMQEYVIEHEFYDFPVAFLRSKKTGRWWLKIPNTHEDKAPFVCISCSESDYLDVFESKIPYRLVHAIERNR